MVEEQPPRRTRAAWLPYMAGAAVPLLAGLIAVVVVFANHTSTKPAHAAVQRPDGAATVAPLPAPTHTDLRDAVAAAGCELASNPNEPFEHFDKQFTVADYDHNPPMGGNHTPIWYQDGIYAPGQTPNLGMTVHPLEHGRIEVQYAPGTPKATVAQLTEFVKQSEDGYHMLLFQNGTKMPYAVAATAWGHALGCRKMNPQVWDALRDFRTAYIDKGPEVVP